MPQPDDREFGKRFDPATWRVLLRFTAENKGPLAVMILLMLLVAGLEALQPFMTGWVIDHVVIPDRLERLPAFMALFLGMAAALGGMIWWFIDIAGKIEMQMVYSIRRACFEKLQELSFAYFDRTSNGWILARLTSDTQKIGSIVAWGIVDIAWGFTMMSAMALLMLITNLKLALVTLAVIPPLLWLSLVFQRRILGLFRHVRKTNSKITASFNEGIMGARTSKTLVREEANLKEFGGLTGSMRRVSVRAASLSSLYLPAVIFLGSIGTALALWRGGSGVITGGISYGVLVSFLFATGRFFDPVMELSRVFAEFQYAQASAERVVSLLNEEPEIRDRPGLQAAESYAKIRGEVSFRNVSFRYVENQPVLEEFNLSIRPGETVALVGETGSGKSTIVNLLCRFYEPTSGEILIDGVDYRERPQGWLHGQLGYVLQTPYLFSGTIYDNILYGRPDARRDEVIAAARTVAADEFIRAIEGGYEADVGPGGNKLSTGQKQLISFARAVLADPRLFVLDEATSSVDTETEALIQKALTTVLTGRTSFLIAHRLSTVRQADMIILLDKGRIVESGTHDELMLRGQAYAELYTSQFSREAEEELLRS